MFSPLREILPQWDDFKGSLPYQLFFLFLIFSQVYYSYRYILSYGSTGTSPTDQNTPLSFQLPKYIVAAAIYLTILAVILKGGYLRVIASWFKERRWGTALLIALALYVALSLVKFHPDPHDFSYQQLIKFIAFMPAALIPLIIKEKEKLLPTLLKVLNLSVLYQIAGFILVYIIFISTGHTPAQGYQGSMVRFGGIWDDPNALGMFLLMPLFTYLSLGREIQERYHRLIYLASAAIAAMIFLSLSVTAWTMLALGLLILLVLRRDEFSFKNALLIAAIFTVLAIFSPYSKNFLEFKAASVLARVGITYQPSTTSSGGGFNEYLSHGQVVDALKVQLGAVIDNFNRSSILGKVGLALFGPSRQPIFNEDFYLLTFLNYGLVGLGTLLGVFVIALRGAWQYIRSPGEELRAFGLASLVIIITTALGLSALPYLAIFPVGTYILAVFVLTQIFARSSE